MKLTDYESIKNYFKASNQHYLFVSPTGFNVLGMDNWVRNWKNINLIDVFDGEAESVILPEASQFPVFDSVEEVNEFLINQSTTMDFLKSLKRSEVVNVLFLFFSTDLEALCSSIRANVILPEHKLVQHVDNKLVTTELGNKGGVDSVPNVMTEVNSYSDLMEIADKNNLSHDLVIQKPFGDSGKTTYFISSEDDFKKIAHKIADERVKVMKKIRCTSTAIEGCATREGTYVGPLLGELVGEELLTPYPGGWCGNEFNRTLFSPDTRREARKLTERIGEQLYKAGYKGCFEVDYLIDLDSGKLYLGELNPRLTGITAITNLSHFCQTHLPLLIFHLLEFSDVEFSINADQYNEEAMLSGACEDSGQLIIKHLEKDLQLIVSAPKSGIYKIIENGNLSSLELVTTTDDRFAATAQDEVFIFRTMSSDEYAYHGADLAIVFTNFSITNAEGSMNNPASNLVKAIRREFVVRDLTGEERQSVERFRHSESQKSNY